MSRHEDVRYIYLGYNETLRRAYFINNTHLVLLKGRETAVFTGLEAEVIAEQFRLITHHLCGVMRTDWVAALAHQNKGHNSDIVYQVVFDTHFNEALKEGQNNAD